jgi:hypothetical protein
MASGTADLQRDLGGAIMQSILGALLTAGYAAAAGTQIAASGKNITPSIQNELTKSFDGAAAVAQKYPHYAGQITAAAKTAFLQGDQWAYLAGIVAVLIGAAVVAFFFPRAERERELLARYHDEDAAPVPEEPPARPQAAPA